MSPRLSLGMLKRHRRASPLDQYLEFNPHSLMSPMRPAPDYLAIVAMVKDERPYIDEWLTFHLTVGCDRFYIYDNSSTDGTREALDRYDQVTWLPWPDFVTGKEIQTLAYKHALASFGHRTRWMAFIDADEFVYPTAAGTLPEALEPLEDLPGVVVPWLMFNHSGHNTRPEGLVTENYHLRAPVPYSTRGIKDPRDLKERLTPPVKSIVDPTRVTHPLLHTFFPPHELWTSRRELWVRDEWRPRDDDPIALNHYFTKSKEEFDARVARGDGVRGVNRDGIPTLHKKRARNKRRIARLIEQDPVEDRRIQRFVPEVKQRMEAFAGE